MIKRGKAEKWAARSERLAASLRQNLKRRKAQARGRTGVHSQAQSPDEEDVNRQDGAGETSEPDFRRNPNGN